MRRLDVALDFGDQHSRKLGVLVADGRDTYFAFDDAFETKPLPVSPIARPAKGELWHHPDAAFAHLPGLLFDAMPDGWGRLLQDRAFGRLDVPREKITPLDRLAAVGNAGLGALVFTPPIALVPKDEPLIWTKDLAAIAGHADALYVGSAEKVLPALLAGGGSPGGARPKVLAAVKFDSRRHAEIIAGPSPLGVGMPEYSDDYFPWIIKFPTKEDGRDAGVVEAAYAEVARASGLLLPETHLFEANNGLRYFGAARFDRLGNGGRARLHVHTMAGLLQADYRMPSCDYRDLLQLTLRLTG